MDEPRWVSQSEAARLEAAAGRPVNQSSISRFLATNPDVPVQRGPSGNITLVEYGALSRARGGSLAVQDKLIDRGGVAPRPITGANSTERKRAAEAETAELNLAERKGQLVARESVVSAIETAGVAFTQALERRRRKLATEVAGIADARAVELAIKAADRELLQAIVADLQGAASDLVGEAARPAEGAA
jgi:hypothetical protein